MVSSVENGSESSYLLDVSGVVTGDMQKLDFERDLPIDFSGDDVIPTGNIKVTGSLSDKNGYLSLDMKIKAAYRTSCARCLKDIETVLETEQSFPVLTQSDDEEISEEERDEYISLTESGSTVKTYSIDLGEICYLAIITSLPTRHLCSQECRGLCPKCGADLNEGECGCDRERKDPRLAGLADFFK